MVVPYANVNRVLAEMDDHRCKILSVFLAQMNNAVQDHIDVSLNVEVFVVIVVLVVDMEQQIYDLSSRMRRHIQYGKRLKQLGYL